MSGNPVQALFDRPVTDYQDVLQILPRLPGPDLAAATAAMTGTDAQELTSAARNRRGWLARWQGRAQPRLNHPRLSLFAGNHGAAALHPPAKRTKTIIEALLAPDAPLAARSEAVDADLRLYEMDLDGETADFTQAAAMPGATCLNAIIYGMMAVDMGLDALAMASCGDGQGLSAAVLCAALLDVPLADMLGQIDLPANLDAALRPAVEAARAMTPVNALENYGGVEIAALFGALLAARMAHTPAIIADWGGLAALAVLYKLDALAIRHVALAGDIALIPWLPEQERIAVTALPGPGMAAAEALDELRSAIPS